MTYIRELLHYLPYLLDTCPYLKLVILLFGVIILVAACCFYLLSFLDATYRMNSQQPFNLFLDRIIPVIVTISPTIILLLLNPQNTTWLAKFGYIILIQLCIIIPIMRYWSAHRTWSSNQGENASNILSWKHPTLYLAIAVGIMYPAIWGIYYSLIKYSRLGYSFPVDIKEILFSPHAIEFIILVIFFLPILFFWALLLLQTVNRIREYLWEAFSVIIYSIHMILLKYEFYFKFMDNLYKLNFIFFNLVSLNAPMNSEKNYYEYTITRRIINNCYYYPIIMLLFVLILVVSEIIFYQRLYYSNYLLFFFPIIFGILKLFNIFGASLFIQDVCMVDYKNQNITNIRYPSAFWLYLENPDYFYGFTIEASQEEFKEWDFYYCQYAQKPARKIRRYRTKLLLRVSGLEEDSNLDTVESNIYNKRDYCTRIKVAYFKTYNVRWYPKNKS